jgi:predicted PurR-regulated permease PerM
MNTRIAPGIIRQILLLAAIVLELFYLKLQFFIPAVLGAYTLYVLLRKYFMILTVRHKWKKGLTAAFLMLLSFLIILLPIMMLVSMMSTKVAYAIEHSGGILRRIQTLVKGYEQKLGFEILTDANIEKATTWAATRLPAILNATLNTLMTVTMMYFVLYFMLTNSKKMETGVYHWMPVKQENVVRIRKDLNNMVISNAIGIPVIALLQGLVGLLGYFIIGVDEPVFWFVITTITAMLPVVGAALAYVP